MGLEILIGYGIGQILGGILAHIYLNYEDNRSNRRYRIVWRKKKNYNNFRK